MAHSSLENTIRSIMRGPVKEAQPVSINEAKIKESDYKVGDDVIYKGEEGEIVKLDEPQTGKYYTVKLDDGSMIKASPDELMPEDEVGDDEDEDEDDDEDEKEKMTEKAVSQAQQKAAGIALAAKRGDIPKSQLQPSSKAMMGMSTKELEKFAKTKHAGLPIRKEEVEIEEAQDINYHRAELKKTSDKIDSIVKSGGRVGMNDPLSKKLKHHSDQIKKIKENVEQIDEIIGPSGPLFVSQLVNLIATNPELAAKIGLALGSVAGAGTLARAFHNFGKYLRHSERRKDTEQKIANMDLSTKSNQWLQANKDDIGGQHIKKEIERRKALKGMKEEVELNEQVPPQDAGEYDYEGDMAKTQLNKAMEAAAELKSMLSDNENLPEWVQKKITMGSHYLDTARDYMKNRNNVPGMAEGRRPKPKSEDEPEKQTKTKEFLVKFEKGGSAKVRSYTGTSELDVRSKAKVDAQRMGMSVASVRLREEVELEEAMHEFGTKQAAMDYARKNGGKVKVKTVLNPRTGMKTSSFVVVKEDLNVKELGEVKSAPKGFHFTKDGKLKRGDADQDGPGGPMLRSDPLDKTRSKVPPVSEKLKELMSRAMKQKS